MHHKQAFTGFGRREGYSPQWIHFYGLKTLIVSLFVGDFTNDWRIEPLFQIANKANHTVFKLWKKNWQLSFELRNTVMRRNEKILWFWVLLRYLCGVRRVHIRVYPSQALVTFSDRTRSLKQYHVIILFVKTDIKIKFICIYMNAFQINEF